MTENVSYRFKGIRCRWGCSDILLYYPYGRFYIHPHVIKKFKGWVDKQNAVHFPNDKEESE